jgi:hypothetical protein
MEGIAMAQLAQPQRTGYRRIMALTLDDLFASPDHYLHSFDGDAAIFVPMDRAAYHRSIFLDARISAAAAGSMRMPVTALASSRVAPSTGWIFHLAHGGSTLLARALDRLAGNLVLREPLALRQLALAPESARLAVLLAMLGKRYDPELPTIIKANVPVNFLLTEIAAADPSAHAIFLWSSLEDYLLAILRGPEHRRWVRTVSSLLAAHLGDLSALSDAECAAALWLAQMTAFSGAMAVLPGARSLESERLFNAPASALAAAAAHLGASMDQPEIDAVVAGPLFASHAKRPDMPFDNAARLARRETLRAELALELATATAWIRQAGGSAELPRPLV